jgi:hypothetical protein
MSLLQKKDGIQKTDRLFLQGQVFRATFGDAIRH